MGGAVLSVGLHADTNHDIDAHQRFDWLSSNSSCASRGWHAEAVIVAMTNMLDYDDYSSWGPSLTATLAPIVPEAVVAYLKASEPPPEYPGDAFRDLVTPRTDRAALVEAATEWIETSTVAAYHGTRLTDCELASVRAEGLLPLDAEARRRRIVRALSHHPDWPMKAGPLDAILHHYGKNARAGRRLGQVHLTLSRNGLFCFFNQYLEYGSEFDRHIADELLGDEGKDLLRRDGQASLVRLAVPGPEALKAANPWSALPSSDIPHLVKEFLEAWADELFFPHWRGTPKVVDCGIRWYDCRPVPPSWIEGIETLRDCELPIGNE